MDKKPKVRGPLYKIHKLYCSHCGKDTGAAVGIDPDRGHLPFDPEGRHKVECGDCGSSETIHPEPILSNRKPTKEEALAKISKDYTDKHITTEQAISLLVEALVNKGQ